MRHPIGIRRIIRQFGIRVTRVRNIQRGVYQLSTDTGRSWGLKRMHISKRQLRWLDRSLDNVRRNGFNRLAWHRGTIQTPNWVWINPQSSYVLTPWIRGRWLAATSPSDLRLCGSTLAKFHRAGKYSVTPRSGAVNKLGHWPKDLNAQHRLMLRVMNCYPSLFAQYRKEIVGYSVKSRELLRSGGYRSICRNHKLASLCHGDGGPTNFIINKKGAHLIDYETLRIDLRAYDLYRIIYNCCKDHNWKYSIARNILDGYEKVGILTRSDYRMLHALLRFPQTSYLVIRKGRYGRKFMNEQILSRAIQSERKVSTFLKRLDRYT